MLIDTDEMTDTQKASLLLQALCFPDATPDNPQRVASLLNTVRCACEVQDPDNASIAADTRQLAVQLEGMVERVLDGAILIEPDDEGFGPSV